MSFKKILVAIDESELSIAAFQQALELAKANEADLMLFHCMKPEVLGDPGIPMPVELGMYPESVKDVYDAQQKQMEEHREKAMAFLRTYCDRAKDQGVRTEFDYKVGEAGHWICDVAKNWEADLVVLGRRGRTGLAEALLGSVSNHVVHHGPCSVMVIQSASSH